LGLPSGYLTCTLKLWVMERRLQNTLTRLEGLCNIGVHSDVFDDPDYIAAFTRQAHANGEVSSKAVHIVTEIMATIGKKFENHEKIMRDVEIDLVMMVYNHLSPDHTGQITREDVGYLKHLEQALLVQNRDYKSKLKKDPTRVKQSETLVKMALDDALNHYQASRKMYEIYAVSLLIEHILWDSIGLEYNYEHADISDATEVNGDFFIHLENCLRDARATADMEKVKNFLKLAKFRVAPGSFTLFEHYLDKVDTMLHYLLVTALKQADMENAINEEDHPYWSHP
jgi:hypothetical protein